ncbi:Protein of unknown function [Bacillus wiedmannii]|nr:Protein of unknown function [Bacillus wiedmannii]
MEIKEDKHPKTPSDTTLEKYKSTALKLKPRPNLSLGRSFCSKYTLERLAIGTPMAVIKTPKKYEGRW